MFKETEHTFTEHEKECMQDYWEYRKEHPEPRKNLIKMVRHINMFDPVANDHSWEYIFYDRQLTDEMVDLALTMKLRTPYYIDELAKEAGLDPVTCAKLADDMVHVGIIEYCTDDNGVDRVQLPIFAPGSMESTIMEKRITDAYQETAPAFLNYILDAGNLVGSMIPMGQAIMRVIPVEEAIQNETKRVKYEELSHWLDKAGDSLGVVECECRRIRKMVGEGTGDLEGEWCISMGKFAESAIRVGKARRITREECEHILKEAEKRGYVHQVNNVDGPDYSVFLCNCSWDTCMALKASWYTNTPNMVRSNYLATVDPKNCVACGSCVEVCPQNAVKLGQKICQKTPVKIAETPDPDEHIFYGKKNWQTDFLTNRKNVVPETGTAPCKSSCPAHIAVQGYLKKAAMGEYREALELIKKENPFPAMCGSVCARFCENDCTRGTVDAPVAIDEVKKFIADLEIKSDHRYIPEKINDHGFKIAIIGSGPAGLSCAYYLAVLGHEVTVFEKEQKPGGMMTYGMPSFRLEKKTVEAEIEVIRELGVEIRCGVEVGKDVTIQQLRGEGYKGFYVAIGAQGGRAIGVPGEDAEGVVSGIDFLRTAESEDKPDFQDGAVVVIGGGNVAVDVARTAERLNAGAVTMVCLEARDQMPASDEEVEEAEAENISVKCGWGPKEILTKDGKVTGVLFKKCTSVLDADGKFAPQYDENETMEVSCSAVLLSVGQSIQWGNLLEGTKVELNRNQTAKADSWTYQTAEPDIFVGGDVYTGPRFAIDAIAAGKGAADSLHRFAWDRPDLTRGRVRRDDFVGIDKENLHLGSYNSSKRQKPGIDPAKVNSFRDERKPFTEEQVKLETARCLECGAAKVDHQLCIGCGVCTTRCKFDAIHLSKEYNAWGVPYEQMIARMGKATAVKVVRTADHAIKRKLKDKQMNQKV